MSQEPKSVSSFIDYLNSDPNKVWSGAMRAFHRMSNEYIRVCRNEYHDASVGAFEKETLYRKQYLIKKIQRLRKVLSTSAYRNYKRGLNEYSQVKFNRFQSKLNKF